MDIDFLKENSKKIIAEDIQIDDTDEIVNTVIEQKYYNSLAYQVCEVAPVHGPTAATFALAYVDDPAFPGKKKIKLFRNEVVVDEDPIEDTGFTTETLQDLQRQYGKSIIKYIGKVFGGISSANENIKLISKLDTMCTATPALTLTDPGNAETSTFEIQQRAAELIMKINSHSFKSLDSFVILPTKAAASVLAISNRVIENETERGLFLGSNSRTKFYLNPDNTSSTAYVGIKSDIPGQSSLIMSPYFHTIKTAVNPENGQNAVFNFNSYAITESALSTSDPLEKMLYKFDIS